MKMLLWLTLYLNPGQKMKHRECWDGGKLNSWDGLTEPVDFGGVLVAWLSGVSRRADRHSI
jgi:hypothetical protein